MKISIALSAVVLVFALYSHFSETKIAYVDNNEILSKYKGAKEAREKLEKESKSWESNIKILQLEMDSLSKIWQKDGQKWSKNMKQEKAKELQLKEQDLGRYTQAVQQKAAQRNKELMDPVIADLNKYIEEYAKDNGYDFVLGTMTGNIVYADKTREITREVIKYVNEQY
jgi:outer membrane protein